MTQIPKPKQMPVKSRAWLEAEHGGRRFLSREISQTGSSVSGFFTMPKLCGNPHVVESKAIAALNAGDVLLVTRLDRVARSTRDLLNVLDTIGKKGAGFRSIADAWADTTTPHGRLMLTVLGGLAQFERELIKARTDEGRKRAMARGIKFGQPSIKSQRP